ncbi:hypothetical protein B0682_04935 [Moraxella lincolnii]|uniref:DUF4124 domain-containing protein n=1 Tax=Lwoffella lincolnii TaxID=90241 RepID=A0A1T0CI17_9GAMM|nr:DUF4124 domain-containing protein [Moraxella lincolnii]OOS21933.1 hypothetical protein B0682_04935 [Moraxella lincolnii]
MQPNTVNTVSTFSTTLFFALTSMASLTATATPIYKVTDNNGKVIFTDRPNQYQDTASDITSISISPTSATTSTYTPAPASSHHTSATANHQNSQTPKRYQLTFISPSEPTPYRRPAQNIDVQLSVTPSLDATDTVQILLDGQPITQGLTASIPTLELNPGEHTLTAQIISHGDGHPTSTLSQVNQTIYVIQNNLAVQNKRALQRKKAVYDRLPWYQKLYFNLRQDNPFADVAKTP